MREPRGFPTGLTTSAVPRWSHRDPVETANPFAIDDARHPIWARATSEARAALARYDAEIDAAPIRPETYPLQLVDLACFRFDTWARRCHCVVVDDASRRDFETWVADYVRNWQVYVAETCPHVDVRHELHRRLTERAEFWTAQAEPGA